MALKIHNRNRGMTLVELLVAIAIFGVLFGAILSAAQSAMKIVTSSKAEASAVALATERMEYIRSLAYDTVGTVGGIPDGPLAQTSTTTLNGTTFNERLLIEYVDDPADGLGASDSNGILADYKLVKVTYSWVVGGQAKSISLLTNIVPPGIETTAGGGTLLVHVFDAKVLPVSNASVHIYNNTGTTTIDTTRFTNVNGDAIFSGAPALSGYQITATKSGYSTDQTYSASSTNPNPITPHVAVLQNQVSTMNFQIDALSNLSIQTLALPTTGTFDDPFDNATQIAATTSTAVSGGQVMLAGTSGSYAATGTVFSKVISPGSIKSWDTASFVSKTPVNTTALVHIYAETASSAPALIPDSVLPGNSAGFVQGSINLSTLDPNVYTSIALGGMLTSTDVSTSSAMLSWDVHYTLSQASLPSIPLSITGAKTIGTTGSSSPIYKYKSSFTTDSSGVKNLSNLEWDVYAVALNTGSYDIAEACNDIPYVLAPGVSNTLALTLAPATTYSLRVHVINTSGVSIPDAIIQLSRTGFNVSKTSSTCGQAFFNSGLTSASDYALDVQATGYTEQSLSNVSVSGANALTVTLTGS